MKTIRMISFMMVASSIGITASASIAPACPANEEAVCASARAIPACHDTNNKPTSSEASCPTGTIPACTNLGSVTVAVCKPLK